MNEQKKESTATESGPPASPSATTFRRPDLLAVLNKNSKYRYRWISFEKLRMNGGMHHNGWRAITALSASEESIIKEHGLEGVRFIDGTIRRYEMCLAFMPVEEWRQLKARIDADRKTPLQKIRAKHKELDYHEFKQERRFT